MTTDSSLLEDNTVLQSFGPLDEIFHFGVTHIWLTFVATWLQYRAETNSQSMNGEY